MAETSSAPGLTVGSLLGLPLGAPASAVEPASDAAPVVSPARSLPAGEIEGPNWSVEGGEVELAEARPQFRSDGVEALEFNNPFDQTMERVWFDGKLVYAIDCGQVDVDLERVKVAQEYQVV